MNYRFFPLVAHTSKVLIKNVAKRLVGYCEAKSLLSKEQCGFRSRCSTLDMMFATRRVQELGWKIAYHSSRALSTSRRHTPLSTALFSVW